MQDLIQRLFVNILGGLLFPLVLSTRTKLKGFVLSSQIKMTRRTTSRKGGNVVSKTTVGTCRWHPQEQRGLRRSCGCALTSQTVTRQSATATQPNIVGVARELRGGGSEISRAIGRTEKSY
ncbi:hypothetical protein F5J12DRAFT_856096 [Pisolithus orientalis]|uniref:uncharacterized protein n=1 Tax=Pisolithus orientalis TaxID=936130 RepID=UPI002223EEB2|nr:uncharacterized protein F5J12DRAFT_856096 [Pisolithus orientalis]KAI5995324.1 hypothetical protein F5J12DRAFT_856096 [Pisolithus orientalis]